MLSYQKLGIKCKVFFKRDGVIWIYLLPLSRKRSSAVDTTPFKRVSGGNEGDEKERQNSF